MPTETVLITVAKLAAKILPSVYKALSAWKDKADKKIQEEIQKAIDAHQAGKDQQRRLEESISLALQSMRLRPEVLEALRSLDSDPILSHEIGSALSEGALSATKLAQLMRSNIQGTNSLGTEIDSIAAIWLSAIQSAIGDSPSLSHALQFESLERIETNIDILTYKTNIIASQNEVIDKKQDIAVSQGSEILSKLQILLQQHDAPQTNKAQSFLEKQFNARFEKYREHLISGSIIAAEQEFSELISELVDAGDLAIEDLLLRSYLNHSACLLMQNRMEEASEEILKAKRISATDSRVLRHETMMLSYQGKNDEALAIVKKLRLAEPNEVRHITNEIAILHDLGRDEELAELLAATETDDVDYKCQAAHAWLRLGKLVEAEAAAKRAIELKPESEGPWIALAYVKGFPVASKEKGGEVRRMSPTKEDSESLSIAIDAALKANDILEKRGRTLVRDEIQTNILAFYALANRDAEAIQFSQKVPITSALSELSLDNLFCLFSRNGIAEKLLEVADVLVQKLKTADAKLKKAKALMMSGRHEAALEEYENIKKTNPDLAIDPDWVTLAARCHYHLHKSDLALSLLNDTLTHLPNSHELRVEIAKILDEKGEMQKAKRYFEEAENLAPEDLQVAIDFGLFLYYHEEWQDALNYLGRIEAGSLLNPLFPNFLVCLFNTGKFDLCHSLACEYRTSFTRPNETVYAVGARAALRLDDVPNAKVFLEQLIKIGGRQEIIHRKMLGQVYLRLDDLPQAYTLLTKVVAEHQTDAEAITLLGQICSALGKHAEALENHVKAVRLRPTDLRARSAFFGSMLALPSDFSLSSEQLEIHHENISILASHPSGILRPIRVAGDDGEVDLTEILQELESKERAVDEALKFSDKNPLPLPLIALDLGASIYDTWHNFKHDEKRGIRMCFGTEDTQKSQFEAASHVGAVSLDLLTLLTLQSLGYLKLLSKVYPRIYVHISVLDEVTAELRLARDMPCSGRIASVKGSLIMSDSNSDEVANKVSSLTAIRDFIKGPDVILSGLEERTRFKLHSGQPPNQRMEAFMAPALVACERGAALLSDDQIFRLFAQTLQIQAFCTQAFLRVAKSNNLISNDSYHDALLDLHVWNYHFVSHDAQTLIRLYKKINGPPSELADLLFNKILKPGWRTSSNRLVLAEFFVFLWGKADRRSNELFHQWAAHIWLAILASDKGQKFAFEFITDLGKLLFDRPIAFVAMMCWLFEKGPGSVSIKKRLFRSAKATVEWHSETLSSMEGGHELGRNWRRQLGTLEVFKLMWNGA